MDIRTRVLSVLNRKQPDVVPWLGDLDYWTGYLRAEGLMPAKYDGENRYQLHRDLGVGIYLQGHFPFRTVREVEIIEEHTSNSFVTRILTPYGELKETRTWMPHSYCVGWTERFVKGWDDLRALRYLYEHTYYEPDYSLAEKRYKQIGNDGIVLCYLPKSPFMEMIALLAGVEAVTYALADAPDELEETLDIIGRKHNEASELAVNSPAECLMIPENLSSDVVGKTWFNRYVRPHDEYWVSKIRSAGKHSFIHIDGYLRGTIKEASETGFTVLEAVTPAPVGDIEIEDIANWVEPDTIIWGGIPGVYFTDLVSDADFDAFVIRVLNVMKTEPRYVLGVADQVPPHSRFERIARVRELVEEYGHY